LSLLARKQRKWKDSLKYINLAMKHTKADVPLDLLISKAKVLIRLGEFDEAITCLNKYDSILEESEPLLVLSDAYMKNKQWELAIQSLQQYLNVRSSDAKAHIQLAH